MIVLSSHQLYPGWSAERLGISMGEPKSLPGHAVDIRGFIGRASIASKSFNANIIRHDQEDVGRPALPFSINAAHCQEQAAVDGKDDPEDSFHAIRVLPVSNRTIRIQVCLRTFPVVPKFPGQGIFIQFYA